MSAIKNPLEVDYVYVSEATGEYLNTHISVMVGNETAKILLEPEREVTLTELDSVLKSVEEGTLKKMRLRLYDECSVEIKRDGQTYTVTLAKNPQDNGCHAVNMEPLKG